MNELRINPLNENKIIFCPDRMKRPKDIKVAKEKKSNAKKCPFCPGNEYMTPPEIFRLGGKKWKTRVFENAFPIFKPEKGKIKKINKMFLLKPAFGYHEIIVESPNHNSTFVNYEHVKNTIETYIQRFRYLSKLKNVNHISIFKNYGRNAGASLTHPHSQIITTSFLPDEIKNEIKHKESDLMKKIIDEEISSERFIFKRGNFVCFAPFFSEYPYEVWIVPKRKIRNILFLKNKEKIELSKSLQTIIRAMKKVLGNFSYNMNVKQTIKHDYHMRITISPKLEIRGGFEIDTNAIINTAIPKKVAKLIRAKLKSL